MTKTKSTKRALLTSALALIMCISMLVGSTFAWFTDSVVSGSNVITAGNLDIEVQYTLDGENWEDLDGANDLFQKGLWEPGHTEVVALRLKNNGTLALKYIANMNIIGETVGKNKDGEDIVLSDILTVSTLVQEAGQIGDIAVMLAFMGENAGGLKYEKTVAFKSANVLADTYNLEAGAERYVIIKVDMAETVGNEANAKDKESVPSINFGINVLATQYTSESDSFGNQYDKDAKYPGEVGTAAELAAALANGESVKLLNNIELTSVLSVKSGASVSVDLNGKTLTGSVEIEDGAALAVANGTVSNTNADVSAFQNNGGKIILDNVVVESARHGVRVEGGSVTINGGTYKVVPTSKKTQHALNISDGATAVINGGTFIGPKGTMADSGAAVNVQIGSTCIINGGTFSGGKNNTLAAKGTLTVFGGTFDQDPSAFIAKGSKVVNNGDGNYTVKGYEVDANDNLGDLIENGNSNLSLPEGEIETNIEVPAGSNVVIEGKGEGTVLNGQIATTSSTEGTIIIRNLTINVSDAIKDSTGISQTSKSAIAIWGNQTVICENVTFNMDLASSTAITSWWDTGIGTSIVARNCTFNCNGNRPIRATGNVTVENCTFNDPYRYAVQLTAKASTATLLDKAIINFNNNTIVNGENGKDFVYGIQLEGADYGCHDCVINGAGNTIVNGGTESAMYYCECGKVDHNTIEWNVEVDPVHEN